MHKRLGWGFSLRVGVSLSVFNGLLYGGDMAPDVKHELEWISADNKALASLHNELDSIADHRARIWQGIEQTKRHLDEQQKRIADLDESRADIEALLAVLESKIR